MLPHVQVILLYKYQKLLDLIRLYPAFVFLKIKDFRYPRMLEDVMAAPNTRQTESKGFDYRCQFGKANVLRTGEQFLQYSFSDQGSTLPLYRRALTSIGVSQIAVPVQKRNTKGD